MVYSLHMEATDMHSTEGIHLHVESHPTSLRAFLQMERHPGQLTGTRCGAMVLVLVMVMVEQDTAKGMMNDKAPRARNRTSDVGGS